jgi:hypothetical protein
MPESEFDKQVQQELQGLRLRPSTAVWENVEKELRRKKRRRVAIVFWLVVAIGLLGYSGYRFSQRSEKGLASTATPAAEQHAQQPAATTSIHPSATADTQSIGTSLTDNTPVGLNGPVTGTDKNAVGSPATPSPSDYDKSVGEKSKNITADNNARNNTASAKQKQRKKIAKHSSDNNPPTDHERVTAKGKYKKQPHSKNGGKGVTKTGEPETDAAGMAREDKTVAPENNSGEIASTGTLPTDSNITTLKEDTAVALVEKKDAVAEGQAPVVKKQGKTPKVKWSVDLAVGGSGPIESPFLLGTGTEKSALNYSAAPSNQGGIWTPIQPPGTFGPVYVPRSDIKPGPAARIGVLVELPVSKRSSISTGLQYQYQSNNIRIGYYKDTALIFSNYAAQTVSVRAVYQGSQQKTFTNRYHYLQVPFNFHWQMNTGRKLPLVLNTGLTAGYLITTNGLVYDSLQGGIYYHDQQAFNRFQLSFSTGVSFRFNTRGAFQWSVGPEFNMGLRRLVKSEYDKKQYPVFLGINARVYLPSRKK